VDVKLPSELLRSQIWKRAAFPKRRRLLALELYREDKSRGACCGAIPTPVAAFMDFAAKHGFPH